MGIIGRHGLGLELNTGYFNTTYTGGFDAGDGFNADLDSKVTLIPAFVNVRFQLGLSRSFGLEVAVGGGGAYETAEATASTDFGDFTSSESAFTAGYQAMVGLSYALGNHADLVLDYRRMTFVADDITAQSVGLGLRLRF